MKRVELGRVAKPHGLRGELKVHPHFAEGQALLQAEELLLWRDDQPAERVGLEHARRAGKVVLVKLAGVDNRDQAEALRGSAVGLPRDALPEPKPGEYYLCDLIGLTVIAPDGEIGTVTEVRVHPSVDSIVVRTASGETVEQPLTEPWLSEIDFAAQRILLSSREGIFE